MPRVQNFVVDGLTSAVEQLSGAKISIGRVDMGIFGKLKLDDVMIYDLQRRPLLTVDHLDSHISAIEMLRSTIHLKYCSVVGAELNIREVENGKMNIQQMVQLVQGGRKPKGKFHLVISDASLEDVSVNITQNAKREPSYGVDYGDISFNIRKSKVAELNIDGPAIYADINSLALTERCGFVLDDLSARIYVMGGVINFEQLDMRTRRSHFDMEYLRIVGNSWGDYRDFIGEVELSARVRSSRLSSDDVAYFAPRLEGWGITLDNINLALDGTVDDMRGEITTLHCQEATALSTKFAIRGLPDFKNSHFEADVDALHSTGKDLHRIISAVSGKAAPALILDMGPEVLLRGTVAGEMDDFTTEMSLHSALGDVATDGQWRGLITAVPTINSSFELKNLRLGKILSQPTIGSLTASGVVDGTLAGEDRSATVRGRVANIMARGYRYRNITYSAELTPDNIDANIEVADKSLAMKVQAQLSRAAEQPQYDIDVELAKADLKAMNINRRDSISVLSGRAIASLMGGRLDEVSGEVSITDGEYLHGDKRVAIEDLYLYSDKVDGERTVDISSDIVDLSYRSSSSYRSAWEFLECSLYQYLPSLYSKPHVAGQQDMALDDNYSMLVVQVKDASAVLDAISTGWQVAPGSKLNMMFNPAREDLTFSLSSDYIEREDMLVLGINCNAINRGDSLALYSSVGELYFKNFHASDYSLTSGIKGDKIHVRSSYVNPDNNSDAMIDAIAQLRRDEGLGRVLRLQLLPSYITNSDGRWDISSNIISVDSTRLAIDNFKITSGNQLLTLSGVASASPTDSLQLSLNRFDVSFLSDLVPALGYQFDGASDGRVVLYSAKRDARIMAHVQLDSLKINSLAAPPLDISARWDRAREMARLSIIDRASQDTLVRGNYRPKSQSYRAQLKIDSLHMALLDPPLKGILVDSRGYANADLTLAGVGRKAKLEGGVSVYDLSTKVGYTNVRYQLPYAYLGLDSNHLLCEGAELRDSLGGSANMTMDIDLRQLTNLAYEVVLQPKNLMVLNTAERDNPIFYGKLFASGGAEIKGNKQGVKMNIAASTDDNSEFYMPLGGKENISSADFIKFVEPTLYQVDTTSIIERKRQLFQRKQRQAGSSGNLEINMALDVKPNTEFQLVIDPTVGDILRGRGEGKLNVTVNPKAEIFDIYGDYSITEGSYMFTLRNIISKKFVINQGSSIQWSGDPLDAQLDISAIYKLKTSLDPLLSDESSHAIPVDCVIHLRDQLMRPTVEFGIDLPTADSEQAAVVNNLLNDQESISRQFFYLMIANSFMPESTAMSGFGASTAAATGFELLTNQLSNWLSATNYNVVIRYRPESETTGEEVDFGFSRGLVGNRLLIELEGNYVADGSQQAMNENNNSNLSGEAYITWLIDQSGALRLKGFTQTIERYDENQGLQETGIGIYYRENFNNFKDLREKIRDRFTSRRRRERREAQRQAKQQAALGVRDESDET